MITDWRSTNHPAQIIMGKMQDKHDAEIREMVEALSFIHDNAHPLVLGEDLYKNIEILINKHTHAA